MRCTVNTPQMAMCLALAFTACTGASSSQKNTSSENTTNQLGPVNQIGATTDAASVIANLTNPAACDPNVQPLIGTNCSSGADNGNYICWTGKLVCQVCSPGAVRDGDPNSCPGGCGLVPRDTCLANGTWATDTKSCSSCPAANNTNHCTSGDGCTPNDVKYVRCDSCAGGNCPATACVGTKYVCQGDCTWQIQGQQCETQQPQCPAVGATHVTNCGFCGNQTEVCDGCFYIGTPCEGTGLCAPNTTMPVPCTDPNVLQTIAGNPNYPTAPATVSCSADGAAGWTSTAHCNGQCQWDPPTACNGCNPNDISAGSIPCNDPSVTAAYPVNPNACGNAGVRLICVAATPVDQCGGSTSFGQNQQKIQSIDISTCTLCGGGGGGGGGGCQEPCTANETSSQDCNPGCGLPGSQNRQCINGCWGPWSTCSPASPKNCNPTSSTSQPTTPNSCPSACPQTQSCNSYSCKWQTDPCTCSN